MALPKTTKIKLPVTLPSKRKVKISPFRGVEEKAMLAAKATKDADTILQTTLDVLSSSSDGTDVMDLIKIDIETLFLKLYEISVSDKISVNFSCQSCKNDMPVSIPINTIKIPENVETEFNIDAGKVDGTNEPITLVMKVPSMSIIEEVKSDEDADSAILWKCLKGFYVGDEIQETNQEEFVEWVLDQQNLYSKIVKKLIHSESLEFKKVWACPKCKHENHTHLRGLNDFFIS